MFHLTGGQYRVIDISFLVEPGADPDRPFDMTKGCLPDGSYKYDIINTHSHVGTHVECAAHFFEDGWTVDQYPLDTFYGRGVLLHVDLPEDQKHISAEYVHQNIGDILREGDIIIVRNARQAGPSDKRYFTEDKKCFTEEAALYFKEKGAKMIVVGPNISIGEGLEKQRRFHDILIRDTPIVEFLSNLDQIRQREFFVMSLPFLVKGLDSSWSRTVVIEKCGSEDND